MANSDVPIDWSSCFFDLFLFVRLVTLSEHSNNWWSFGFRPELNNFQSKSFGLILVWITQLLSLYNLNLDTNVIRDELKIFDWKYSTHLNIITISDSVHTFITTRNDCMKLRHIYFWTKSGDQSLRFVFGLQSYPNIK